MSQEHQKNQSTSEPQETVRYHKDSAMRDLAIFINKKLTRSKKSSDASENKSNNTETVGEESVEEDPTPSEIEDFVVLQGRITEAVEVEV